MSTVAEIENALQTLPVDEAWKVADWLQQYLDEKWGRQIEADAKSGKLDLLWERAKADITVGKVKPLDEVLNDE
jgi:hypothetical protein